MINQGGIFADWTPSRGISGTAIGGRVWVHSINSLKGTAIVYYRAGGIKRPYCAKLADLARVNRANRAL